MFPRFLSIEAPQELKPKHVTNDEITLQNYFYQSHTFQDDRNECLTYLEKRKQCLEDEENTVTRIILNLSHPRYDWHCMIFEAAFSRGLHQWLVDRQWLLRDLNEGNKNEYNDLSANLVPEELKTFCRGDIAKKNGIKEEYLDDILLREI